MERPGWDFIEDYEVVLASASPRRKELLSQVGLAARVEPSDMEEEIGEEEPESVVLRLSRQKAEDVANRCKPGTIVIGADTVVAADGGILGKPITPLEAAGMLGRLSGKFHQVYTGVTLILIDRDNSRRDVSFAERTGVRVYPMEDWEIQSYVDSGEPLDKAGAYGIQGKFASFIQGIDGDYANVVGLPVGRLYHELKTLLSPAGIPCGQINQCKCDRMMPQSGAGGNDD